MYKCQIYILLTYNNCVLHNKFQNYEYNKALKQYNHEKHSAIRRPLRLNLFHGSQSIQMQYIR